MPGHAEVLATITHGCLAACDGCLTELGWREFSGYNLYIHPDFVYMDHWNCRQEGVEPVVDPQRVPSPRIGSK